MVNINLLPEDKRRKGPGAKPTGPIIATTIVLLLGIGAGFFLLKQKNHTIKEQIAQKDTEISKLNKVIRDYKNIQNQIRNIQSLVDNIEKVSSQSAVILNLLDDIVASIAQDTKITGLVIDNQEAKRVNLSLTSKSVDAAARVATKLSQNKWAESSMMNNIKYNEAGQVEFTVQIYLPGAEKDE